MLAQTLVRVSLILPPQHPGLTFARKNCNLNGLLSLGRRSCSVCFSARVDWNEAGRCASRRPRLCTNASWTRLAYLFRYCELQAVGDALEEDDSMAVESS
jgi:hypothetical protein